jgi:hypothetical protein
MADASPTATGGVGDRRRSGRGPPVGPADPD